MNHLILLLLLLLLLVYSVRFLYFFILQSTLFLLKATGLSPEHNDYGIMYRDNSKFGRNTLNTFSPCFGLAQTLPTFSLNSPPARA